MPQMPAFQDHPVSFLGGGFNGAALVGHGISRVNFIDNNSGGTDEVSKEGAIVAVPDDAVVDDFKSDVRAWLAADNELKRLTASVKEKKRQKDALSEKIMGFMSKFNVEDLNTRDGRLRYKVTSVMAPLSQKMIKERLASVLRTKLGDDDAAVHDVHEAVFGRERVDKVSLRRLRTLA
jgi:Family of unknown function (DUF5760)